MAFKLPGGQVIGSPSNGPIQPGNIPGLEPTKFTDLGSFLSNTFPLIMYLAATLMIFWAFWGVFEYIFAGGNKDSLKNARKRITYAIVGFLLVAASFVIWEYVQTVFPQRLPNGVRTIPTINTGTGGQNVVPSP